MEEPSGVRKDVQTPAVGLLRSPSVSFRLANDGRLCWGSDTRPEPGGILRLYDTARIQATDFSAPLGDSLVLAIPTETAPDANGTLITAPLDPASRQRLDGIAPGNFVTQYQAPDGQIHGAALSLDYEAALQPVVEEALAEIIDLDRGAATIAAFAQDYERRHLAAGAADGPPTLNMAVFLSLVMSFVQDRIAGIDLEDPELEALLSAHYLSAYYCGVFFVRDGYRWKPPGSVLDPDNPDDMRAARAFIDLEFGMRSEDEAATRILEGVRIARHADDAAAMAFLTHHHPDSYRNYIGGTGIRSLISNFGYNTGYSHTVNEQTAGGALKTPPPGYLTSEGEHPPLTSPEGPMPKGVLLGNHYDPCFTPSLARLAPYRDRFAAMFPLEAAALTDEQNREELRGRMVWTYRLHDGLIADQRVRNTVWAFNNSYLNMVHVAALLNLAARVENSPLLARRAALAASSVTKAYLWAYTMGVKTQLPRRLPRWNPGVTPLSRDG